MIPNSQDLQPNRLLKGTLDSFSGEALRLNLCILLTVSGSMKKPVDKNLRLLSGEMIRNSPFWH